jgi:hypothetical protein
MTESKKEQDREDEPERGAEREEAAQQGRIKQTEQEEDEGPAAA